MTNADEVRAAAQAISAAKEHARYIVIHANDCPYPKGGECVCYPYRVNAEDPRPSAAIWLAAERLHRWH